MDMSLPTCRTPRRARPDGRARTASTAALAVALGAPSAALARPAPVPTDSPAPRHAHVRRDSRDDLEVSSVLADISSPRRASPHPATPVPADISRPRPTLSATPVPADISPPRLALTRRPAAHVPTDSSPHLALTAPVPAAISSPLPPWDPAPAPKAIPAPPAPQIRPKPASPAQAAGASEAAALAGRGAGPPAAPPPYRLLRADEDYRYLRDPTRRADFLDLLKYIPLGPRRRVALGFGGEVRQRLDRFRDLDWGQGPPRSLSWLQRYMVHAELRAPSFRAFVQLKSARESGRPGGPRDIDRDDLDVHQAFADFDRERPGLRLVVRAGRHELAFGSGRLVSPREGPNVRRSFDGLSIILAARRVRAHLFVTRPVATRAGVFDDGWEPGQWFAGAHVTAPSPLRGGQVDVYAFYLDRPEALYQRGRAHERRLSLGTRWFGDAGPFDYNLEAVLQAGKFGAAPLLAWTLASDTGVRLPLPWRPRLGVRLDVASGDRGPGRPMGTFSALFPKGSYFGEDGMVGPANFWDAHPMLSLAPLERLSVTVDWVFLWRYSLADGVYNVPGEPIVDDANDARFIGHRAGANLEAELGRHVGFIVTFGRFFRGAYLTQAGRTRDVDFIATWLTLKF